LDDKDLPLVSALAMFSSMAGRSAANALRRCCGWHRKEINKLSLQINSDILSDALEHDLQSAVDLAGGPSDESWDNMTVEERVEQLRRLVEQLQGDVDTLKRRTSNPATF
jgi:hypothetical protein